MAARARPLSPHLQVYRLPLVALMSISHRATGVILALGLLLIACWLGSVAYGPDVYGPISGFVHGWIGRLFLFLWSACLYFHLCNGIRHLAWDLGFGFKLPEAHRNNRIVLGGTVVLTLLTWIVAAVAG